MFITKSLNNFNWKIRRVISFTYLFTDGVKGVLESSLFRIVGYHLSSQVRETDAPITSRWKSAKSLQFMSLLIKSMISVLLVIK